MKTINDGGPAFPVPNTDHQAFGPKTVADLKRLMSGNLNDVARYVTEFGLSDFFVQAECSGNNSLMLLRMPTDWPTDHLGPLKAIT